MCSKISIHQQKDNTLSNSLWTKKTKVLKEKKETFEETTSWKKQQQIITFECLASLVFVILIARVVDYHHHEQSILFRCCIKQHYTKYSCLLLIHAESLAADLAL